MKQQKFIKAAILSLTIIGIFVFYAAKNQPDTVYLYIPPAAQIVGDRA